MAGPTIEERLEALGRRVARGILETTHINTINLVDRLTIDFVWYPGALNAADGIIDVILPVPAGTLPLDIPYRWERTGHTAVTRNMVSGRITLPLPPGSKGVLTVFDTSWEIQRTAAGVAMSAANTIRGVQERLNRLGYHLRFAGQTSSGVDGVAGKHTEKAILAFQAAYQPPAPLPPGAPAARLQVRGEWTANPGIQADLDTYNGAVGSANPSAADGASFQSALVAIVGA